MRLTKNKILLIILFFILIITAYKLRKVDTLTKEKHILEIDIDTLNKERYNVSKSPILKIGGHKFIIIGGKDEVSPILVHKGSCESCLSKKRDTKLNELGI
jgi:hypothetical protein